MSSSGYAGATKVSVEKTMMEIRSLLNKTKCDSLRFSEMDFLAQIDFVKQGRLIRFKLTLPSKSEPRFHRTPGGRHARTTNEALKAWEQACRSRWRALYLCLKAKLIAVEEGVTTFETEFLPHTVNPANNKTVAEEILPQLAAGRPIEPLKLIGS